MLVCVLTLVLAFVVFLSYFVWFALRFCFVLAYSLLARHVLRAFLVGTKSSSDRKGR